MSHVVGFKLELTAISLAQLMSSPSGRRPSHDQTNVKHQGAIRGHGGNPSLTHKAEMDFAQEWQSSDFFRWISR